jgi:undecaprenyl diphosphate synthase
MPIDNKKGTGATGYEAADLEELHQRVVAAGNLPKHVAIIMDGNGRWARRQGLARVHGHRAGRTPVREVIEAAARLRVEVVTLYTFSIENWSRPAAEIKALMTFLKDTLREERDELARNNVRLMAIGRIDDLPSDVRDELDAAIDALSKNTGLIVNLALSYGGRAEIVDAVRALAASSPSGAISPDEITEEAISARLYTSGLPDPDLLIRTSGELRISNFLLWQLAYAEIHVTDVLWPDFRKEHLYRAIQDYQNRERRFGRVD